MNEQSYFEQFSGYSRWDVLTEPYEIEGSLAHSWQELSFDVDVGSSWIFSSDSECPECLEQINDG